MIGKFKRIEYDLCRFNEVTAGMDAKRFVAANESEQEAIEEKVWILRSEGWRLSKNQVMRCECGKDAHIDPKDFTTTCGFCGADYNGNGDRLADRSQWGEETGEHWTECY